MDVISTSVNQGQPHAVAFFLLLQNYSSFEHQKTHSVPAQTLDPIYQARAVHSGPLAESASVRCVSEQRTNSAGFRCLGATSLKLHLTPTSYHLEALCAGSNFILLASWAQEGFLQAECGFSLVEPSKTYGRRTSPFKNNSALGSDATLFLRFFQEM